MHGRWRWVALGILGVTVVIGAVGLLRPTSESPYTWAAPGGELRDLALRLRVIEGEGPTIVLLHGLVGSNRYFGARFDRLAADGRLVAPDLLGFGGSPRPESSPYDATAHAQAVRSSLESLGVEPPVFLIGHSAGALVALELAAEWPEVVRGVVAFGAPLYRSATDARDRISGLGAHVRFFAMEGTVARWVCDTLCSRQSLAIDLFSSIRRDLPVEIASDVTLHSWTSYSRTLRNLILSADVGERVARLRVPVLLVAGEEDSIVDLGFLREVSDGAPSARLEIWPGGHDLPLSDPDRSVAAIRAFVTAHAQR